MRSDKPNSSLAEKLDALDIMPEGIQFRQSETWAGIEADLAGRKRRNGFLLLRAAAILLLAIGLWWLLRPVKKEADIATRRVDPEKQITTAIARPEAPAIIAHNTPVASSAKKKARTAALVTSEQPHEPVALAQVAPADTASVIVASTAVADAAPPKPRFRIGHMNETPLSIPATNNGPAEESSAYGFLRPANNGAGPNANANEPERKPRTLMSLFKSHQ
jgi:type II secretory pathway component PulM